MHLVLSICLLQLIVGANGLAQVSCVNKKCTIHHLVINNAFDEPRQLSSIMGQLLLSQPSEIEFVQSHFTEFPSNRVGNMRGVLRVSAEACGLVDSNQPLLSSNTIFIASNVIQFLLNHNNFPKLTDLIFEGLENLQILEMAFCNIKSIDKSAFDKLINLHLLRLDSNQLTSLDLNFFRNTVLEELHVQFNTLTVLIVSEINPKLITLLINNNQLTDIGFVKLLINLVNLSIGYNRDLEVGYNSFRLLSHLQKLWIPAIKVRKRVSYSTLLETLVNLEFLDMGDNALEQFDIYELPPLKMLKRLALFKNGLSKIDHLSVFGFLLPNLKEIDLSDNDWNCEYLITTLKTIERKGVKQVVFERYDGSENRSNKANGLNINGVECKAECAGLNVMSVFMLIIFASAVNFAVVAFVCKCRTKQDQKCETALADNERVTQMHHRRATVYDEDNYVEMPMRYQQE